MKVTTLPPEVPEWLDFPPGRALNPLLLFPFHAVDISAIPLLLTAAFSTSKSVVAGSRQPDGHMPWIPAPTA
jgi:hypothetical protein